jgi:hypothetical protein
MPSSHQRETLSSLLATHTAIRVARDVGYPPLEVPPPVAPIIYTPTVWTHIVDEPEAVDFYHANAQPEPDFSVSPGLVVFFVLCLLAGFLSLWRGVFSFTKARSRRSPFPAVSPTIHC